MEPGRPYNLVAGERILEAKRPPGSLGDAAEKLRALGYVEEAEALEATDEEQDSGG